MKARCVGNVWSGWNNTYRCVVYSGKEYDVLKEDEDGYIIRNEVGVLAGYPKEFFEEVKEVEKEKVLEVGFQDVFDKVAWRITYQNEDVLKRGEFKDRDIEVRSTGLPIFSEGTLYILGFHRDCDNDVQIVSKEQAEIIKQKVNAINEKYGIPKKWRAKKGEVYYYIDSDGTITAKEECGTTTDDGRYKFGNYAKTKEELEFDKLEKIKNILAE